jgi:hypothetical protein
MCSLKEEKLSHWPITQHLTILQKEKESRAGALGQEPGLRQQVRGTRVTATGERNPGYGNRRVTPYRNLDYGNR